MLVCYVLRRFGCLFPGCALNVGSPHFRLGVGLRSYFLGGPQNGRAILLGGVTNMRFGVSLFVDRMQWEETMINTTTTDMM